MEEKEELIDLDNAFNEGDEYSPDHYWMDIEYGLFECMMEQLKHDVYNMIHFGDPDGPVAYAAELLAEEEMMQENPQDWMY